MLAAGDAARGRATGTSVPVATATLCSARGSTGGSRPRAARSTCPTAPGVIAEIALALGRAGVNIVDMALSPSQDNSQASSRCGSPATSGRPAPRSSIADLGFPVVRA